MEHSIRYQCSLVGYGALTHSCALTDSCTLTDSCALTNSYTLTDSCALTDNCALMDSCTLMDLCALTDSCTLTDLNIYTLTHTCTWRTAALWRIDIKCAILDYRSELKSLYRVTFFTILWLKKFHHFNYGIEMIRYELLEVAKKNLKNACVREHRMVSPSNVNFSNKYI